MITDSLGPLSFGLFLLAVLGTFALGAAYIVARLAGWREWARVVFRLELAGVAVYVLLYLAADITSRNRELTLGEEKHICEMDCHLAYAVTQVRHAPSWEGRTARGVFTIVTLRVRFDSATISPRRPRDAPVWPGPRYVALIDDAGRAYPAPVTALTRTLRPGEAYDAEFAFDLPAGAAPRRLDVRNADWPTHLLIAHENALLHGRTTFRLDG